MTQFTIHIDDVKAQLVLNELQRRLENWRPTMDRIGASVADRVRLTFVRGQDPWGRTWKSLSEVTQTKRRKGSGSGSNKPLRDTGRLMNSISHRVTSNDSVDIGSDTVYAGTHQFGAAKGQYGLMRNGAPIPWGNIPARPFMPIRNNRAELPAGWRAEVDRIVKNHLFGGRP